MSLPSNWKDVQQCTCDSCKALAEIYLRCKNMGWLFIQDARMFDRGFVITNISDVFVRPSAGPDFTELQPAVDYVLERQGNCDAYMSSWPLKSKQDYLWKRERIA